MAERLDAYRDMATARPGGADATAWSTWTRGTTRRSTMSRQPLVPEVVDLSSLGRGLLDTAHQAASGRAAQNLLPGPGSILTQTVVALATGAVLADHATPGPATLQVLDGVAVLTCDGDAHRVQAGEWVRIPDRTHGLRAATDVVFLLTVTT